MHEKAAYQIVAGTPRRVYGARDRLTRETHSLVVATSVGETAKGKPDALWFTDLRRGRLNIYGGLLRFLDHLHRRGIPMETALLIPQWIESYVRAEWEGRPAEDVTLRKAA